MARKKSRLQRILTPGRKLALGVFVLYLLGILPGLYVTWTRTRWKKSVKMGLTVASAVVLIGIIGPMTNPPAQPTGGVVLVGKSVETEVFGPEAPEGRSAVEVYTPVRTAIILEATQEPEPIIV